MEPQVLVLDEPFANLDYSGMLQVLSQIVDLHQAGKTIILSTHDLDKTMGHAGRLILMKNGSIVKDGLFENVIRDVEMRGRKNALYLSNGSSLRMITLKNMDVRFKMACMALLSIVVLKADATGLIFLSILCLVLWISVRFPILSLIRHLRYLGFLLLIVFLARALTVSFFSGSCRHIDFNGPERRC